MEGTVTETTIADEQSSPAERPAKPGEAQFPFNYRYFVDLAAASGGRILDYGCGEGQTVALARERGLDIWGADTFAGFFAGWADSGSRDRVHKIENGRADYPDNHFDLIISNQVLEHVSDPEAVISDMHRMIKPGGTFIAAFPVVETWYEGHVGLISATASSPAPRGESISILATVSDLDSTGPPSRRERSGSTSPNPSSTTRVSTVPTAA
jgi:SAM-dependent methyltransferase